MEINNDILMFASDMNQELENNKHKGDYKNFTNKKDILSELDYHINKLKAAIENDVDFEIKEYIADCGNILMFLGNSYNFYTK